VFIHICQNAIQLLAFDANLGIRTYEILKNIRTNNINYNLNWFSSMETNNTHNDGIRILVNSYCTDSNKYTYLKNERIFQTKLVTMLSKNNKIVVPCNSKTKAIQLHRDITKLYPNRKVLLYTGDCSISIKRQVSKCSDHWIHCDVVIYTSIVGCGVDFNPTTPYFDYMFVYGIVHSTSVHELLQMMGRIRTLVQKHVFVYVQPRITQKVLLSDYQSIEQLLQNNWYGVVDRYNLLEPIHRIQNDDGLISFGDPLYMKLYIYNTMESNMSTMNFANLMQQTISERGGKQFGIHENNKRSIVKRYPGRKRRKQQ
jgi:hypothetical protein